MARHPWGQYVVLPYPLMDAGVPLSKPVSGAGYGID